MSAQTGGRDGQKQEGKETLRGKRQVLWRKMRLWSRRACVTTAWRTFWNCMDADFLHPPLKQQEFLESFVITGCIYSCFLCVSITECARLGCKVALKRAIMPL